MKVGCINALPPKWLCRSGIYVYVTLVHGEEPSDELKKELVQWVRKEIGPIASPDVIQWAPGLPKTRSGKILRKTIRQLAFEDEVPVPPTIDDPAIMGEIREALQSRGIGKYTEAS